MVRILGIDFFIDVTKTHSTLYIYIFFYQAQWISLGTLSGLLQPSFKAPRYTIVILNYSLRSIVRVLGETLPLGLKVIDKVGLPSSLLPNHVVYLLLPLLSPLTFI